MTEESGRTSAEEEETDMEDCNALFTLLRGSVRLGCESGSELEPELKCQKASNQ